MSPGVEVTLSTHTGPPIPTKPVGAQFFVGITEMGPTDAPVSCSGMADFVEIFGGRVPYSPLYDTATTFFAHGGSILQIVRLVGPNATTANYSFMDGQEEPEPAFTVEAVSAGDWAAGRLTMVLRSGLGNDPVNDPELSVFDLLVYMDGRLTESYRSNTSAAQLQTRLANASNLLRVSSLGDRNPVAVTTPATLIGGNDDRGAITTADYIAALDKFNVDMGTGAVAIPGMGQIVHEALLNHAESHHRVALLDVSAGMDPDQVITISMDQSSQYGALFVPWIQIADQAGGARTVSPLGMVAGLRASAWSTGPWIIPAGNSGIADLQSVVGLDQIFTRDEAENLDHAKVSVIRRIGNLNKLYGYRSLSNDEDNYAFLSIQDLLNYIVLECQDAAEQFVFQPVDGSGALLAAFKGALVAVVDPIAQGGGLYAAYDLSDPTNPAQIDQGYTVDTSPAVNSSAMLAKNTIAAIVAVRPAPSAAMIRLSIVRVGFSTPLAATG